MKKNKLNHKGIGNHLVLKAMFIALLSLFFSIQPINSNAQSNDPIQSNASFAEKIYLQLDTKTYTLGNIVWFKCVVLNACDHVPSSLSQVLYVELITPEEIIKEKKLVKIEDGIGQGFFSLDKNMEEGLYQIRAYTGWDKNFGTDFFFEEYIHVFANNLTASSESPINNVTLIKGEDNSNRLKATFLPQAIDSLQKRKLMVIVAIDDKKDTLEIKSDKNDQFILDYEIGEESHFATIQMQTENNKRFTKTIVLNEDILDLQFFPESGEMVHGLQSRVGFKALDANGQGKRVEGDIVDERDSVVTSFKSNIHGMGSFLLTHADSTQTYYARIKSSVKDEVLMYQLPKVASRGNILVVERRGENIMLAALSNYIKSDSIHLNITFRGMNLYDMKVAMKDGVASVLIPISKLPEGIISCTMKDRLMQPVAERLYFVERRESRIDLAISTDKESYAKREETKLDILASNSEGDPVNANLSVLVINKSQLGEIQSTRQNILSYFLLESELKGNIENPGYYFSKDTSRQNDLDALMLTQGWRKYNYSKEYEEITFYPEHNLSVKGWVGGSLFEKNKKEAELILMTFGKEEKVVYKQRTDSVGNFKFNLYDEYGEEIKVVIQSSKKSGKKADYTITLNGNESPPVTFLHTKTVEKLDSVIKVLAEKNMERSIIDIAFPLDSGNILIDEVKVTALELTPERKKVIVEYGESDVIISGNVLQAKEKKWSWGLSSLFAYDSDFQNLLAGFYPVLYVIDGKPVQIEDMKLLETFPVSEIKSYEVIRDPKNFESLYLKVVHNLPSSIVNGAIVAIYTHGGHGIFARRSVGIMRTNIHVFSDQREFYAPKYATINPDVLQKPDLRALIHWAPVVQTDSLGNASVTFYNADNGGKMMVIVEAISEYGEIGYKEIEFNVEGKEEKYFILN